MSCLLQQCPITDTVYVRMKAEKYKRSTSRQKLCHIKTSKKVWIESMT